MEILDGLLGPQQEKRFFFFLLGPGFGESILLREPGNRWVVIDSFRSADSRIAAIEVLKQAKARLEGVVLTHPHADHAPGLRELLDYDPGAWVGCWRSWWSPDWFSQQDLEKQEEIGAVLQALSAIQTRWSGEPAARWELEAGSARQVGLARLTVLHPPRGFVHRDMNACSSPILVERGDLRLLLGADLPGCHWDDLAAAALGDHQAYKMAHHGSRDAHSQTLCRGPWDRQWVVAPFNRRREKLPRFEDGHGIHRALSAVGSLLLSALPDRRIQPRRRRVSRKDLCPVGDPLTPGLSIAPVGPPLDPLACWIRLGFDARGRLVDRRLGARAVEILEEVPEFEGA